MVCVNDTCIYICSLLNLFGNSSMELSEKSEKGACWRALETFARVGTKNDSLRATILGNTFAHKVCDFVEEKYKNVLKRVLWRWIIMPGRDGKKDICVGFHFDDYKTRDELRFEISKFYEEVLGTDEWWGYTGKNFVIMVCPERPQPFSFNHEPADYISSRPSCDDAEASGRPKVEDETVSGPSERGRKRRKSGGARRTSSCSQKRTSLGETQNV